MTLADEHPVGVTEEEYDHLEIGRMVDPFTPTAEIRKRCPIIHTEAHDGYWVLMRHQDVGEAAANPALFSSGSGVTIPSHAFPMALPPIEIDAPQHRQFRSPLVEHFSPTAVGRYEADLRRATRELIAAFIETGRADLAQQLTMQLPAAAVSLLLNIPERDHERLREATVRLIQDTEDMEAAGEMLEYFAEVYDDRRENPQDDLPTLMLGIEIDGRPILEEEYFLLMNTLVAAGLDTTANAASHILLVLSQRLDLRAALVADATLRASAIEELLRYTSPLPSLSRTTTTPTELCGHAIAAGERVQLNWLSANHDPEAFENPESIILDRANNRHFSFGAGPHRCLGAHLARLELRILLEEVLDAIPDYVVDESGIERTTGITRGLATLPATFTPRPASALRGA